LAWTQLKLNHCVGGMDTLQSISQINGSPGLGIILVLQRQFISCRRPVTNITKFGGRSDIAPVRTNLAAQYPACCKLTKRTHQSTMIKATDRFPCVGEAPSLPDRSSRQISSTEYQISASQLPVVNSYYAGVFRKPSHYWYVNLEVMGQYWHGRVLWWDCYFEALS
jgi:hypothetical protein